ncbi:MAG: glucose-6-phosphate isomerase, partial [Methylovirgula sp.]
MDRSDLSEPLYALEAHRADMGEVTIADLFARDPQRFAEFHVALDDILFDFSKHRVDRATLALLLDLARAANLEERRAALFAGEIVNPTELRPALHMALRNMRGAPMHAAGIDVT